jgi:alkylhydroperoxidase family enzyme
VDGFGVYRHPDRKIAPVLRELGQTRAGWLKASQFVFSQHCKSLRGLGVGEAKIAAVPHWEVSDLFDDQERAVLAYADCLCQGAGRTPPAVFERLRAFWGDEEILEFTYITCLYDMHAVMSRALRLEFDDRDDPIVEVAAPESFSAADFLGAARPAKT